MGNSLRRHHPDWKLWLCVTDKEPDGFILNIADEPYDEILYASDLKLENVQGWLFGHDVVEACTAVKGPILQQLTSSEAEKIIYLDPDIAVFNNLQPLVDMLDEASVLLTPHQVDPDYEEMAIYDNEISGSLKHGIYNLGFIAIRNDEIGRQLANWWSDRCKRYCYDDPDTGLFVDQKWCDFVPAFFDRVRIVRDPGYNVASWNLNKRMVTIDLEGQLLVNGNYPLYFYHFTKLGPIGDTMTRRYAADNVEVYELWSWYKRKVVETTDERIPDGWWHYGMFSNGEPIPPEARVLYRTRGDLQAEFPDPFNTDGGGFAAWYQTEKV